MQILVLYDESQTYTSTVLEHLESFKKYSKYECHFLHYSKLVDETISLENFHIILVHYSVRLPAHHINEKIASILFGFKGIKGLFIQDEYDNVARTKYWIKRIRFDLIFTVVPERSIEIIYPKSEFPDETFINNLTGYAPSDLNLTFDLNKILPPSTRSLKIGYRGRRLPIRYGMLGIDKFQIGEDVKKFCKSEGILCDIETDEQSRIYGDNWYQFLLSSKAMLGSESGSNIFDWNGDLHQKIKFFKKAHRKLTDFDLYQSMLKPMERDGLMNQISPRIFEMAAACTVMILYEGNYSDIIKPHVHYLPLKKDLSNIQEIISRLNDDDFIDEMALNVRRELIDSGGYSYQSFICMVDGHLDIKLNNKKLAGTSLNLCAHSQVESEPKKAPPPFFGQERSKFVKYCIKSLRVAWDPLPYPIKKIVKKIIGRA